MMSNGNGSSTDKAGVLVGGGLSGAIAIIIVWAAKQFWGIEIPADVASAMAFVLIAIGGWIGSKF